ncbi:MAG: alanine racemase, partial [Acidimicrobiia bacterium]
MIERSRRSFLTTLLQATCVIPAWRQKSITTTLKPKPTTTSFDPWIEVHQANLSHNVQEIQRRVAARPILAVIKNNGYGLGGPTVAGLLEPLPAIAGFAVVKFHEAVTLRDAGVRKPILLMGPFDEAELAEAVARDITPMVYTTVAMSLLERLVARVDKVLPVH